MPQALCQTCYWKTVSLTHKHIEVPEVAEVKPVPLRKRVCRAARRCLCDEEGQARIRIFNNINLGMRRAYPAKGDRDALADGNVVAMCVGIEVHRDASGELVESDLPCTVLWFHVAFILKSPWDHYYTELEQKEWRARLLSTGCR